MFFGIWVAAHTRAAGVSRTWSLRCYVNIKRHKRKDIIKKINYNCAHEMRRYSKLCMHIKLKPELGKSGQK